MRTTTLFLASLLVSSAVGWAGDLGCSEATLRHKYGAPTSTEKNPAAEKTITFEKPGTLIEVELRQGKCVSVSVTKIGEQLSLAEAKRILNENAQGQDWQHDDKSPEVYRRGDGTTAYVNPGFITIATPDQEKISSGINSLPVNLPAGASPPPATPVTTPPAAKPAGQLTPAQQDLSTPGK
jgi:hypothetical protein